MSKNVCETSLLNIQIAEGQELLNIQRVLNVLKKAKFVEHSKGKRLNVHAIGKRQRKKELNVHLKPKGKFVAHSI